MKPHFWIRRGPRLAAWGLGASLVAAATVVPVSEDQLTDRADLIVHGTVVSSGTAYRTGSTVRVFTEVELEVHEVLKGAYAGSLLTLAMPGGVHGSHVVHVPGTPRFTPGEQVCVFLAAMPDGLWTTLGISQGKFRLMPDPATGLLVAQQAEGARSSSPGGLRTGAHALRVGEASDWASFRRRIRSRSGAR